MSDKQPESRTITMVVIMHARDPWDEATLWMIPSANRHGLANAIANGQPPDDAVSVFGPAKMGLIDELSTKLCRVLNSVGVTVTTDAMGDD